MARKRLNTTRVERPPNTGAPDALGAKTRKIDVESAKQISVRGLRHGKRSVIKRVAVK